jgi:putative NADPH-quinone reductase
MIVSIILGHPDPQSFNHAIAATASRTLLEMGCEARLHDLCAEGFDPLLPAAETARDASCPHWWSGTAERSARRTGSSSCIPTGGECPRRS